jgi:hypothetical protein
MEQLGLINVESGEAIVESTEYIETASDFDNMLEIAKNYGIELGRLNLTPERLNSRIWGFADGLAAENPLTDIQRELLRNECFAAARPWLS